MIHSYFYKPVPFPQGNYDQDPMVFMDPLSAYQMVIRVKSNFSIYLMGKVVIPVAAGVRIIVLSIGTY